MQSPELRGGQQFPAPGLRPASQHEQPTGPWAGNTQAANGVLNAFVPPAPVEAVPLLPSASMAPQLAQGGFAAQQPPTPQQPPGSPPGLLPLSMGPSVTPWVQTVPQAMPWGTTSGPLQLMRFSAGDQPTWVVNERQFRKRHLPLLGAEPPRKQAITEEKIAAQFSDLSLDGLSQSSTSSEDSDEKRLHVLCPVLEATPPPEPLLPRPVMEDLRKRTSMAVVLWQPPLPAMIAKAPSAETNQRETKEEEEASMEL